MRLHEYHAIIYSLLQGQCGSCWAHSAEHTIVGTASIVNQRNTGKYLDRSFVPSRQQTTVCTPNEKKCGGEGGCAGATAQLAFDYIEKAGGLVAESVYPYTAGSGDAGVCDTALVNKNPKIVSIGGFSSLASNDVDALMTAVQEGPVAISVAASNWAFYGGGIFNECHTGEQGKNQDNVINHAVTLVGYGTDER
jgi:cathepsin L